MQGSSMRFGNSSMDASTPSCESAPPRTVPGRGGRRRRLRVLLSPSDPPKGLGRLVDTELETDEIAAGGFRLAASMTLTPHSGLHHLRTARARWRFDPQ